MYNLILMASKPDDWTHEQFITWWRGEHAEMTYPLPGLRRWQHTEILDAFETRSAGWDGVSILSFDDRAALDAALASDEWKAAVAHVGTMRGRRIAVMGEEKVMVAER
ncbi:EthD family reductase [Cryptosporangium sp. NPDC051539]|uniref:EthD family reductase n=1 Tax=Cryptosporangium sp. NPDC051539 TaxID=3363962 RepID=UPI0037AA90C3